MGNLSVAERINFEDSRDSSPVEGIIWFLKVIRDLSDGIKLLMTSVPSTRFVHK